MFCAKSRLHWNTGSLYCKRHPCHGILLISQFSAETFNFRTRFAVTQNWLTPNKPMPLCNIQLLLCHFIKLFVTYMTFLYFIISIYVLVYTLKSILIYLLSCISSCCTTYGHLCEQFYRLVLRLQSVKTVTGRMKAGVTAFNSAFVPNFQ